MVQGTLGEWQSNQRITPFLWFDRHAEEAARFYTSIFKNSKVKAVTHYGEAGPLPKGTVMTVVFELEGQEFIARNGGPHFKFTEAVSFVVNCETQKEVDEYGSKLLDSGQEVECGWLKDRYGLSWQVVPTALGRLLQGNDPVKSNRMMEAPMQMKKLDIAKLEAAYNAG